MSQRWEEPQLKRKRYRKVTQHWLRNSVGNIHSLTTSSDIDIYDYILLFIRNLLSNFSGHILRYLSSHLLFLWPPSNEMYIYCRFYCLIAKWFLIENLLLSFDYFATTDYTCFSHRKCNRVNGKGLLSKEKVYICLGNTRIVLHGKLISSKIFLWNSKMSD